MPKSMKASEVKEIIFVCEAGVGSSLMSVNALKKKLKQANVNVPVTHYATSRLPHDSTFVVCHKQVMKHARMKAPEAVIVGFDLFFNDPVFDRIVKALAEGTKVSDDM